MTENSGDSFEQAMRWFQSALRSIDNPIVSITGESLGREVKQFKEKAIEALKRLGEAVEALSERVPRPSRLGRVTSSNGNGTFIVLVDGENSARTSMAARRSLVDKVKPQDRVVIRNYKDDPNMAYIDEVVGDIPWE